MKKKSILVIALSLVFCALLSTGVIFAYLTATSDAKTNTFTKGNNISIKLAESKWDNKDYDGLVGSIPNSKLGINKAKNIMPNRVIPKNPSVKNTSNSDKVWIAIQLDYKVGGVDSTYLALDDFATIVFDTRGNWEAADRSNEIFYFKTKVPANGTTTDLFSNVSIDDVDNTALKPFSIQIKAYAVQAEGVTYHTAKTELNTLIGFTPAP